MPRRARLSIPGIAWHIIQRGNNRSACFYAEDDYQLYLRILEEQAKKQGCLIHAYVLMTNHVHLLLTPERHDSASLLMKNLGQRYVQYINRTYRRSGTLWEGRFRSCLARDEHYVLGCYRYIELNPVRAAMVAHPRNYKWSSFQVNGAGDKNFLITPHENYLALGADIEERLKNYNALFAAHIDDELISDIRRATNGNFVLGHKRFQEEVAQMLGRRVVPGRPGRSSGSGTDHEL